MVGERDIELAEDVGAATDHGGAIGRKLPVTIKWFHRGQWRRFQCEQWTFTSLMTAIRTIEPNFRGQLFYRDSDGDAIVFSTDKEMLAMVAFFCEQLRTETIKLESKEPTEQEEVESEEKGDPSNKLIADPDYSLKPVHCNVVCDVCEGVVRGIRYKCLLCPDFDLCERCEKTGVHEEHPMCRLATPETLKPSDLWAYLPHSCDHRHGYGHQWKKHMPSSYSHFSDLPQHAKDQLQQKFEVKRDKLERKCAKKLAKREQHLRDRAFRAKHRLERFTGFPAEIGAGETGAEQLQQQQQNVVGRQQAGRVEFLKEIGQRVQQALKSFGIECDAEIQDEHGIVHGSLPLLSNETFKKGSVQISEPAKLELSGDGFVYPQRIELIGTPLGSRFHVNLFSANEEDILFHFNPRPDIETVVRNHRTQAIGWQYELEEREGEYPFETNRQFILELIAEPGDKIKCLVDGCFFCTFGPREDLSKAVKLVVEGSVRIHSLHLFNANESQTQKSSLPTLASIQQAEMAASLASAQEAAKHASQTAISSLEAATQLIGEIFAGFDPSAGQTASRVGQSIVEVARQGAENLTDKLLNPDVFGSILLQTQHQLSTMTPGDVQKDTPAFEEKVVVDAHLHKQSDERHIERVQHALPPSLTTDSCFIKNFSELNLNDESGKLSLNRVDQESESLKQLEKIADPGTDDSDVEILEHFSSTKSEQTVQLGSKRKLKEYAADHQNMDDLKSSTHTVIEGYNTNSDLKQEKRDGSFDLNMSSVSSRTSSSSTSSSSCLGSLDDDSGTSGWMVVKKESFKKLCDFYEKRRRLEKDGDHFASQLEREFHEALSAIAEDKTPDDKKSISEVIEQKNEIKIVDVIENSNEPDELIGHSANFADPSSLVDYSRELKQNSELPPNNSLYPVLEEKKEVCTAGIPYPGYVKPIGMKHNRDCAWKHKNLIVQRLSDQLVEMGFDNCNGWLYRIVEHEGNEMDRIFATIDADPMYRARIGLL